MPGQVLVLAEHRGSEVDAVTQQVINKGRELADAMGAALAVLTAGRDARVAASALSGSGADLIYALDDPRIDDASPDVRVQVTADILSRTNVRLVLLGYSLVGMELAPALATKLGIPAFTNCTNVEYVEGEVVVTRPVFDGTFEARIVVEGDGGAVIGLQGGGSTPAAAPRAAAVEEIVLGHEVPASRYDKFQIVEEQADSIDISKADILISVGRGIGDKESLRIVEELAEVLGGVLSCSRPVVDVGWMPRERQVGASGKSVTPKVYVACGISGASQHLAGIGGAKRIIAINQDPEAPIFQVAQYGVVGDLFDIVPALTKAARTRKA